jgi:hypothetical protein
MMGSGAHATLARRHAAMLERPEVFAPKHG